MSVINCETLICGGGIIGLTIAREMLLQGYKDIVLIEKESSLGVHASGKNSGVLHAGIYYAPGSLRANSCVKGNRLMKEYCKKNNLPIAETGKVIVVKNENELNTLNELYNRAKKNGVHVELIDESELKKIEPHAKTFKKAIYSPETSIVDPKSILEQIYMELTQSPEISVLLGTELMEMKGSNRATTNNCRIYFERFINAAGAFSDIIAHNSGVGLEYSLVPFTGTYKKLNPEKSHFIKGNIYPVPDIKNPFLGVHLTQSISGDVYIGPTAFPSFKREEQAFNGKRKGEFFSILLKDAYMFLLNSAFRRIALTEPKKYFNKLFYKEVTELADDILPEDILPSEKRGIRPQLINKKSRELVMDFVILKNRSSIHILNAISPAFTSSMDFAKLIVNDYVKDK